VLEVNSISQKNRFSLSCHRWIDFTQTDAHWHTPQRLVSSALQGMTGLSPGDFAFCPLKHRFDNSPKPSLFSFFPHMSHRTIEILVRPPAEGSLRKIPLISMEHCNVMMIHGWTPFVKVVGQLHNFINIFRVGCGSRMDPNPGISCCNTSRAPYVSIAFPNDLGYL